MFDEGAKKEYSCSCAVAAFFFDFLDNFFCKRDAHIFKYVQQLNVPDDRAAIICDLWSSPAFLKAYVAPFWSQRKCHNICKFFDSCEKLAARFFFKYDFFWSGCH